MLHLNSRVLRGRMLSVQMAGVHPWSVAVLASMASVAPGREGCLERRDAEHTCLYPL